MKVFVLTNVPVPYRMDFFNELGRYCELEVLFEQSPREQSHRSSSWFNGKADLFKASFLYNGDERKKSSSVKSYLENNKNSLIVVMGYSLPAEIYAIAWLKTHHVPFLLSCDGGFVKHKLCPKSLLKRFLIKSASGYLSTGKATDEFLTYYGAKEERIYRIPFTTLFAKDILCDLISDSEKRALRDELGIKESKIVVSVGQFIRRKGYDVLLNACANMSYDIGFYIIGNEPTNEYLILKDKLSLTNVHFVGFQEKSELCKYYKAADLFVLPTREDVWGLVINEAMAYGLPIVTTNRCIAGLELVDDGNGRIVPVDNVNALKQAILSTLLNEDYTLRKMGQASLKRIQSYTIENMASEHFRIFKDFYKTEMGEGK